MENTKKTLNSFERFEFSCSMWHRIAPQNSCHFVKSLEKVFEKEE